MTAPDLASSSRSASEATGLRFGAPYVLGWLPITAMYVIGFSFEPGASARVAAARAITVAAIGALLALPVWRLTGRMGAADARGGRRVSSTRALAVYVATGVAFAVAHALMLTLCLVAVSVGERHDAGALATVAVWDAFGGLWLYALVLSVMLAARAHLAATAARRAVAEARASAEALRARAELHALRANLNPHLLFNTLNAIASVVDVEPARARAMLVRLSRLLRRLLDLDADADGLITLATEWELTMNYLAIERERMGDRLHVHATGSDEAFECRVPAFVVQSLVENAIRHGIAPRPGAETLVIDADVITDGHEGALQIVVEDDGLGADAQRAMHAPGLGLRLTRQRLAAAYGERATLTIATEPGRGFRVSIRVPASAAIATPANAALA